MAEKRSAPDDHGDSKRTKAGNGASINIQEQIAAARARAAAARERLATTAPAQQKASPAKKQPSAVDRAAEARARIEALKARVTAATKSTTSDQPEQNGDDGPSTPEDLQSQQSQHQDAKGSKKARVLNDSAARKAPPVALQREPGQNPYIDTSHDGPAAPQRDRRSRGLVMNQQGKFIAQGAALRRQAQLEEMKRRIAETSRRADLEQDKSEQGFLIKDIPGIEWWDEGLVDGDAYPDRSTSDGDKGLKIATDDSIITSYIQHPILLDPPSDSKPFKAKPLPLTKAESKKLRRQNRMTELKEKQAKVRLGLEEPEAPKVKKSNLMRVLGEQAVRDPTAVEARVNRELAERAQKHDDTNEARKLSKEDRVEKAKNNADADAAKGLSVCVYRIGSLAYGKNRAKILMEAKWCHDLTGVLLTNPRCCVLVVEAGSHTTTRFKKLMLRRINWTENVLPNPALQLEDETEKPERERGPLPEWLSPRDAEGKAKDLSDNSCELLWEGEAKDRRFRRWNQRDCATEGEARQTLERNKFETIWQMAKGHST